MIAYHNDAQIKTDILAHPANLASDIFGCWGFWGRSRTAFRELAITGERSNGC